MGDRNVDNFDVVGIATKDLGIQLDDTMVADAENDDTTQGDTEEDGIMFSDVRSDGTEEVGTKMNGMKDDTLVDTEDFIQEAKSKDADAGSRDVQAADATCYHAIRHNIASAPMTDSNNPDDGSRSTDAGNINHRNSSSSSDMRVSATTFAVGSTTLGSNAQDADLNTGVSTSPNAMAAEIIIAGTTVADATPPDLPTCPTFPPSSPI